jgi:hypothetical protein
VGLYLNPPQNAVVTNADEKPSIQVLERAQGWLRLPNRKAVRGRTHEYPDAGRGHGSTTLFAALEVHGGIVHVGHYRRKRRQPGLGASLKTSLCLGASVIRCCLYLNR